MDLRDEDDEKDEQAREKKFAPRKRGSFHEAAIAKKAVKPAEPRREPVKQTVTRTVTRAGSKPQDGSGAVRKGAVRLKRPS